MREPDWRHRDGRHRCAALSLLLIALVGLGMLTALLLRGPGEVASDALPIRGAERGGPGERLELGPSAHGAPERQVTSSGASFSSAAADDRVALRSAHDGQPLPDGWVVISEGEAPGELVRASNPDGLVRIPAMGPGVTLLAEAPGYFPAEVTAREWATLERGPAQERILPLRGAAALRVRVRDAEDQPIEGAYVRVEPYDPRTVRTTRPKARTWPVFERPGFYTVITSTETRIRAGTDADGEFIVPRLPAGRPLLVTVGLTTVPVSRIVQIDPGTREHVVTIPTAPSLRVVGRVLNADGTPARGAQVRILPEATEYPLRRTNVAGEYAFDGVPPVEHVIVTVLGGRSAAVRPSADGLVRVADLVLPERVTVTGRITAAASVDSARSLAADVRVIAFNYRGPFDAVLPRADGCFTCDVEPGPIRLEVRHRSTGELLGARVVTAPCADADLIVAATGGLGLELVPPPAGGRVQVSIWNDAVQAHAVVDWLPRARTEARRWTVPVTDGIAYVSGVPTGTYCVGLRADSGGAWKPGVALADTASARVRIELGTASVAGSVGGSDGAPRANVAIAAQDWAGERYQASTDAEGRFRLDGLLPGPLLVGPEGVGSEAAVGLLLSAGGVAEVDLLVPTLGGLRGRVLCDGLGLAGVRIWHADKSALRRMGPLAITDQDGAFAVDGLAPGLRPITFSHPDPGGGYDREQGVDVDVPPGSVAELMIEWSSPSVPCRVSYEGEEIADVEAVTLDASDGSYQRFSWRPGMTLSARTVQLAQHPETILSVVRSTRPVITSAGATLPATFFVSDVVSDREGTVTLVLAEGRLHVVRSNVEDSAVPLLAGVLAIGRTIRHADISPPMLQRIDVDARHATFVGVPPGAEVELGSEFGPSRRVRFEGEVQTLTWP